MDSKSTPSLPHVCQIDAKIWGDLGRYGISEREFSLYFSKRCDQKVQYGKIWDTVGQQLWELKAISTVINVH